MVPTITFCLNIAVVFCLASQGDRVAAAFGNIEQHWLGVDSGSFTSDDRSGNTKSVRLERSVFSGSAGTTGCSEASEISENTIIRTKDSRLLGARFLNETSLGSDARDKCMALCCVFHGCNVAVYEEKDGGNCYLFDCGPIEDFRCKFTQHSHYTSGVIRRREINAHEEELTELKQISAVVTTTPPAPVVTKPITAVPPTTTSTTTAKPVRTCSRYQFECHTTGECIAIYNACDGIVQCSDGSDEAPELGCPATTTEAVAIKSVLITPAPTSIVNKPPLITNPGSGVGFQQPQHLPEWGRSSHGDRDRFAPEPSLTNSNLEGNRWRAVPDNSRSYGGGVDRVRASYQASEREIYPAVESDRSVNPYYNPESNHRYGPSYGRDQERTANDYRIDDVGSYGDRYSYDKEARPYDTGNVYPTRKHDWERNSPSNAVPAPVPVDNRYPVVDRPLPQSRLPPVVENAVPQPAFDTPNKSQHTSITSEIKVQVIERSTTPAPVPEPTTVPATTTTVPLLVTKEEVAANHAHVNHFHVNQADYQEERAERSRQTIGAIWALTLGCSVTAVLVLLVGCRLRSLKRHLRRGRGGHARDADYLVNGMYL